MSGPSSVTDSDVPLDGLIIQQLSQFVDSTSSLSQHDLAIILDGDSCTVVAPILKAAQSCNDNRSTPNQPISFAIMSIRRI